MQNYFAWKIEDQEAIQYTLMEAGQRPPEATAEPFMGIWAATWEEAMAVYNIRMGWGPYKPAGEAKECECKGNYYPEGSGKCWRCQKQHT